MAKRKTREIEAGGFDAELADMPANLRWQEWMNRVEAVLFAAQAPVTRAALARVVGRDASIDLLIEDIRESLRAKPYDVVNVAGGWMFRTRAVYAEVIAATASAPARRVDLGQNEAMVLVSIAYHQPVTRAVVSQILGREVSRDVIGSLREKAMISAGPRSPSAGAPATYVTTPKFLEHFELDTLRDLPDIEALEDAGLLGASLGDGELPIAHSSDDAEE